MKSKSDHPRIGRSRNGRRLMMLGLLSSGALTLAGCGSQSIDVAAPALPSGGAGFVLQAFSTAGQYGVDGSRAQVRARLNSGVLGPAARSGAASARVCLNGTCVDKSLSVSASEANCEGFRGAKAGAMEIGIGAAWIDGDTVGVDFCVRGPDGSQTFETSVTDGFNRSNAVRTSCTRGSSLMFCASR